MNNDINLISDQSAELEKELGRLQKFRLFSIICLVMVSSLSILVFVLNLILPLDAVKKEQNVTVTNISVFHQKLVTYTLLTDRVKNISTILSQRGNYIPQVNNILAKTSTDLSIDGLEIKGGKMSLSISGTSLLPINQFIDDMVNFGNQGKVIKDLIIQSLSLDGKSGRYSLTMEASLP